MKEKELESYADENGDVYTFLIPDGKTTLEKVYIAEMMWRAFKGEIPLGLKIAHIDGNKANNDVRNLGLEVRPIGIDTNKKTLKRLGEAAMAGAVMAGMVKIADGVFLYDNKVLSENQKKLPDTDTGKNIDYASAHFWVLLQPGGTISPCNDPMEVADFFDTVNEAA